MSNDKPIRLSKHAFNRAYERGVHFSEIKEAIISGVVSSEKNNRFSSLKVFKYNEFWEGKFYTKKQVKIIFTEDNDKIIVLTVISKFLN